MKQLVSLALPVLLLLAVAGCSKEESTSVGPVTDGANGKKAETTQALEADFAAFQEEFLSRTAGPDAVYSKTHPIRSLPVLKKGAATLAASPPVVANGGFESGFDGWTTEADGFGIGGDPSKAWFVGATDPYQSLYPPGFTHSEPIPHSGDAGASAVANGPTNRRMYQDIELPATGELKLQFWIRWKNFLSAGFTPISQDIIVTLRNPATNSVLQTVFQASAIPGLPRFSGGGNSTTANYELRYADVTAQKGETVRLYFEINNRLHLMFVDLDDIEVVQILANQPPVANAGPDQTVECTSHAGATVTLDGTGSTDPDNDPLTYSWTGSFGTATGPTPQVTLPLGVHEIVLTVDDGQGETDKDTVVVTVQDTTPPSITLVGPDPLTLECPTPYSEPGAVVTDLCDPNPTLVISGTVDAHSLGTYTVTYTATDASGNSAVVTRTVHVVDTQAPVLSCSTLVTSLFPANHKMINVGLGVSVSDACDPSPAVQVKVYSNEDDLEKGSGKHSPDADKIGPGTLELRAERMGHGSGRVYLIVVTATDQSGNTSFHCCTVVVPHDQSKRSTEKVNELADAAKASCGPGGSPLTPYLIGDGPVRPPKK